MATIAHAAVGRPHNYGAMDFPLEPRAPVPEYSFHTPQDAPSLEARGYRAMSGFFARPHEFDLYKRDELPAQTDIDLKTAQSWYWGSDNMINMNLTCYTMQDNERLLGQESFADAIATASCTANSLAFTLSDATTYAAAHIAWGWVNHETNRTLTLVTENIGCTNETRQPWIVSAATFDSANQAVSFTATPTPWIDAIPRYGLRFSHDNITEAAPPSVADAINAGLSKRGLQKRFFFPEAKKRFTIDVSHDFSRNIFDTSIGDNVNAKVDCNPCGTKGKLNLDVDVLAIIAFPPRLEKATATLTPDGVGATVQIDLALQGELTNGVNQKFNLVTIGLPGSINILGLVIIGPQLQVDAIAQLSKVTAKAAVAFGVEMDVPASAIANLDLVHPENNKFQDWTPVFTPIPPTIDASVSVTGSVAPEINVQIGFNIKKVIDLAGGIALQAPQLSFDLSAQAESAGGVCGNPDAHLGLNFDVNLGVELDAFGGNAETSLPNKFILFATSTQIFSTCLTVAGGAPAPTDTTATTTDAAPATTTQASPTSLTNQTLSG
ncbi:hypothetical protein LTR15_003941 [Elasticomyces elasticus]|nr:hypothetical protein LTR15_003941 [Elasticomyces elasticus]